MPGIEDLQNVFVHKSQEQFNTFLEQNPLYRETGFCNIKTILYTPAIVAAEYGWLNTLKLLKRHNANMDEDIQGTPLYIAACFRQLACVDYLLRECKAKPNFRDENGMTPLFNALDLVRNKKGEVIESEENTIGLIQVLLASGANPNIPGLGDTPLHMGVRRNHHSGVRLLILACANLNIKNTKEAMTPMELAKKLNLTQMQTTIESAVKEKHAFEKIIGALKNMHLWGNKTPEKIDEGCKLPSGLTQRHVGWR